MARSFGGNEIEANTNTVVGTYSRDCEWEEKQRVLSPKPLHQPSWTHDRPSMSSVILMLDSEGVLPQPREPGFFSERHVLEANSNPKATSFSGNEDISTILEA
uniref:Uncharacterized protein n=1 Tax=Vitis vinifera TaxID=29760 RepID=F6H2B1_VITVI